MKKNITWALLIVSFLFLASCKKDSPGANPHAAGSWSFKSKNYTQANCYVYMGGELVAASNSPGSTMLLSFYNTVPTTGGTYDVVHNEFANQVAIELDDSASGAAYLSYNYSGAVQPVTISVSAAGKISVSGSNVTLYNQNNISDSANLSLSIVEQ